MGLKLDKACKHHGTIPGLVKTVAYYPKLYLSKTKIIYDPLAATNLEIFSSN